MEGGEFVEAVKRYVRDESIEDNLQLFAAPQVEHLRLNWWSYPSGITPWMTMEKRWCGG